MLLAREEVGRPVRSRSAVDVTKPRGGSTGVVVPRCHDCAQPARRSQPAERGEIDVRNHDLGLEQASVRASTRRTSSRTPFARAFRVVASIAASSESIAVTGVKPSVAAAIAITPEPQPTSRTVPRSSPCRASMHSRVVGWAPVPNARPGSITTESSPVGDCAQGGPIQSEPTTARWKRFHSSSQPAATAPSRSPAEALPQPAGARVVGEGRELDRVPPLFLDEALREQLEHRRRRLFGPLAPNDDGRTQEAQRKALFSFSKKPSSGRYVLSSPFARTRRAGFAAPR